MKNQKLNQKLKSSLKVICLLGVIAMLPEMAFADETSVAAGSTDAFNSILTKTNGWVSGSAGKLVTFSSLTMAGIMGVAGFPTRYVVGALGTGLLLSSAKSLVNMIF